MLENNSQSLTRAEIQDFERSIKANISPDFVDFYLQHNGGVPQKERNSFYDQDHDNFMEINCFMSIKYSSNNQLTIDKRYERFSNIGFPTKYLPFAIDWGGNCFCLDLETGEVVMLYFDLGEFSNDCVRFLANSFKEFIDLLEEYDEDDV